MVARLAPGHGRWCLRLAWDGSAYVGWQRQPNGVSVQARVEEALLALTGQPVRASASGRTDAGVHARAQVVAVDLPEGWAAARVVGGLNHHLPADISCLSAAPTADEFDPRRWVRRKLYRYRILARATRCPFRAGHTWLVRRPLDVEAMARAALHLEGRQDFASFRAQGCAANHTVRTLEAAVVRRADDELHLDFTGNGFLRHQVRIFTGTLVEVGLGRLGEDAIPGIITARDRSAAGPTAPARGLWLVGVELGDGPYWEAPEAWTEETS